MLTHQAQNLLCCSYQLAAVLPHILAHLLQLGGTYGYHYYRKELIFTECCTIVRFPWDLSSTEVGLILSSCYSKHCDQTQAPFSSTLQNLC